MFKPALMGLIDDERVVCGQLIIEGQLSQQDAIGHEFDAALRTRAVLEAHLAADRRADLGAQFGSEPVRERPGGNAPRLGMTDHPLHATSRGQTQLGQLGGTCQSRCAAHDDDAVAGRGRRRSAQHGR